MGEDKRNGWKEPLYPSKSPWSWESTKQRSLKQNHNFREQIVAVWIGFVSIVSLTFATL